MSPAPLAITIGDPAGVGPELIPKLVAHWRDLGRPCPLVAIGPAAALDGQDIQTLPLGDVRLLSSSEGRSDSPLPVIDCPTPAPIVAGVADAAHGPAIHASLETAARLALDGSVAAILTMPINKAVLRAAGQFTAPGHTEFFARASGLGDGDVVMMLAGGGLRVVPVTIHIGIKDVAQTLRADDIVRKTTITYRALKSDFGIAAPRIAIAALNPHGGEDGLMGGEEATHIQPAIWALEDMGIAVTGPLPADTLFHAGARDAFDAVICMYHDQALIPLKTLDFWGGVNATLGLPFIRTSPDHGTAYDIAGKGICRADSAVAAFDMALSLMARNSGPTQHGNGAS